MINRASDGFTRFLTPEMERDFCGAMSALDVLGREPTNGEKEALIASFPLGGGEAIAQQRKEWRINDYIADQITRDFYNS